MTKIPPKPKNITYIYDEHDRKTLQKDKKEVNTYQNTHIILKCTENLGKEMSSIFI